MKYERPYGDTRDVQHIRDGASLPKLFTLIDAASPNPAADGLALLRWIIFQILIGNT
jgi:serine/threonine-protein kinase HipA